jgi:hypothetical protein
MKLRFTAILPVFCVGLSIGSAVAAEKSTGPVTLKGHIQPLLQEFCVDCHNEEKHKGDFSLTPFLNNPNLVEHRKAWEKVLELVESREMPPEKKPQPTQEQRDVLLHFIEGELAKADCVGPANPGKVTIRRLNREEYKNTIRDLMGVQYEPEDFPNDEVGYGFDNIGDVLSLPPMLMEKYLAAAEEIVGRAIVLDAPSKPVKKRLRGDQFESGAEWIKPLENKALAMHREGEANAKAQFPHQGEYTFRVRASADLAGPELPKLTLGVGGKTLQTFEIGHGGKSANYELKATLSPGSHRVTLGFLNNYNDANNADPKLRGDRNIFVEYVEIETPPGPPPALPASHQRLITRMPQPGEEREVALEILGRFLPEAYRRPVENAEVERVAKFVELAQQNGGSFLEGIQASFQAALCSPHFLFRWELDPASAKPGHARELSDYEVASRLSYFLWTTKPDAELSALAAKGELRRPAVLEQQIARMVKDWRIRAFVNNFGGQWLQIRNIWEVDIDRDIFPKWKDNYKGLMKEETERFLEAFIREDRPVTELLDADFTYLNEELAGYYGIAGVKGKDFQRVTLPKDSPRGGIVTMGSVLVSTSTPTRTSPVIRGKWILEQILGTPPPPAPPDVPPLPEQKQVSQTSSVRQRLEQHRSQAECAGCHNRMDPLGFALENFDAAGAWREMDGKFPIDASGKLANGTSFNGARDLKQVLKANKNFIHGLTEKMLTYALGRGLEHYDKCAIDNVMAELAKRENRFSALVIGIVTSDPFLKRRPEIAQN